MNMNRAPYAAFGVDEYRQRFERAREALASAGCLAAVVVAPEHLFYLAGYDSWVSVNSPQALMFTPGDDAPTLLVRDVDLSLATESTWVGDVRTYSLIADDFPALVAGILAGKRVHDGPVAIETRTYALPLSLGQDMAVALAPRELHDATALFGQLRLLKSPAERRCLERAAGYANRGLRALRESARVGATETEVAAAIESALRAAGSDYPAIPTELSSGSRSAGCHATPRRRRIEPGELVHAEFAGVEARYHATAIQTLACGEPSARTSELYRLTLSSLVAGVAAVEPGAGVADVEEASLQPLRVAGLEQAATMRFGYGIGVAYPPIWLETLQIARGFDQRLAVGMVFVLHACIELPDEQIGIIAGGTYALDADGVKLLAGAGGCDLLVI